eukprot:5025223-Prymnesium_polylepis.3
MLSDDWTFKSIRATTEPLLADADDVKKGTKPMKTTTPARRRLLLVAAGLAILSVVLLTGAATTDVLRPRAPKPPSPPPPPSPAPPSYPPGFAQVSTVRITTIVPGTLESFNASTYKSGLASLLNVDERSIELNVTSASIRVEARIREDADKAQATLEAVQALNASQLADAVGSEIEEIVVVDLLDTS